MMKRVFFLCFFALFVLFLLCGCQTVTGSFLDSEESSPAIKTTYPYKFYVSSIKFYFGNISRKLEFEDKHAFISGMCRRLATLYPDIFTDSPSATAIPITYDVVFLPPMNDLKIIMMSFVMVPFTALSVYSGGFLPTYIYCGECLIDVRVNVAKNINFSCQKKVFQHIRANMGLLGFFNTRKLLPDLSDGDVPTLDGNTFSPVITTSEYSEKFLNLLVYALQRVDHKQVLLLYNEKYRPREDFILP